MAKAFKGADPNLKGAETVVLVLSTNEAETLRAVVGRITGSTDSSPRGYTDNIWNALGSVGFETGSPAANCLDKVSMFFKDYSDSFNYPSNNR